MHVVAGVEGDVQLKRDLWADYHTLRFGTQLQIGDLLKLEEGSLVTIVCGDLSTVRLTGKDVWGVECRESEDGLVYRGSRINRTRGSEKAAIPIILSPRKTKIINPRPVIRWEKVHSVTSYSVVVRGCGASWRRTVGAVTWLAYPDAEPALKARRTCTATIHAGTVSSAQEETPDLGFQVLGADDSRAVRDRLGKIEELNLSGPAKQYLRSLAYASRELRAAAIDELEQLSSQYREAGLLIFLGSLYVDVVLYEQAADRFQQALELARHNGDTEAIAVATRRLGTLYLMRGNYSTSTRELFQEAAESYEILGDTQHAAEAEGQVNLLYELNH